VLALLDTQGAQLLDSCPVKCLSTGMLATRGRKN
jgi:hypothetical protein